MREMGRRGEKGRKRGRWEMVLEQKK